MPVSNPVVSTPWTTLYYYGTGTDPVRDLTWTSAGTAVNVGNGVAFLRYKRVAGQFLYAFYLQGGSTTVWGSNGAANRWFFNLPAELVTSSVFATNLYPMGVAPAYAVHIPSTTSGGIASILPVANNGIPFFTVDFGGASGVGYAAANQPFAWTTGDYLVAGNAIEALDV